MTTEVDGLEVALRRQCAPFICDDPGYEKPWMGLMRCPECSGWLPHDFPVGRQFHCRRCGTVLETIPDEDEDPDMELTGRLCIVPEEAITIDPFIPLRRVKTKVKKTSRWAMGLNFVRRIWTNRDGEAFITVNGERILINDVRIDRIIEEASE